MIRQLAFELTPISCLRRADFFSSPANADALAMVDDWAHWPQGKLLLIGPSGSGKTHLAKIWADDTAARIVPAADLADADLPVLAQSRAIVVEDASEIAGQSAAETALFHLHNMVHGKGHLLITATAPPRDWGLRLADLLSRMQALAVAQLNPPDDALLSAVLIKLFSDRQITVPPNVIAFLLQRMDRSIAAAQHVVAALDSRALAAGRPVTRALAADLFDPDPLDSGGSE